jgi:hypothetical protein
VIEATAKEAMQRTRRARDGATSIAQEAVISAKIAAIGLDHAPNSASVLTSHATNAPSATAAGNAAAAAMSRAEYRGFSIQSIYP